MTKILDAASSFNGSLQKIVELSNGFIINGQYYNKSNLAPKALKFFKTSGSTQDLSLNKKMALKVSTWVPNYKNDKPMVIADKDDPQITYVFSIETRSSKFNFFKFRETQDDVQLLMDKNFTSTPAAGAFPSAYAGQNADYIYYIFQTNATSGTGYFVRINKKDLTMETIISFSTYNPTGGTVLYENDAYIFYGFQRYFGDIAFYRYTKASNVNEAITVPNHRGKGYFGSSMSEVVFESETVGSTYTVHQNSLSGEMYINKYTFDFSVSSLGGIIKEDTQQTVIWTGFPGLPMNNQAVNSIYETFIVNANDGKKFLVVGSIETNGLSTIADAPKHGFYVFEMLNTGELQAINFTPVSTTSLRGFIYTGNKKLIVAATDSTVYFLNFDELTKKYTISDSIDSLPTHVGFDSDDNIWYVNNAEEVEMVSINVPTVVDINFEKQNYKYEGIDVATYIDIDARNYQGSRVGVKLELTIRGDAVFESNNAKIIQEITDLVGPKRVNLLIKGSGGVTIYPKLIM